MIRKRKRKLDRGFGACSTKKCNPECVKLKIICVMVSYYAGLSNLLSLGKLVSCTASRDVVSVSTSRSRDRLETY